jgi:hypothetical protein
VTWTQVYDPPGALVAFDAASGAAARCSVRAIGGAEGTATPLRYRRSSDRGARGHARFPDARLLAVSSFFYGAAFGLLKIVWIVIAAVSVCKSRRSTERMKDEG